MYTEKKKEMHTVPTFLNTSFTFIIIIMLKGYFEKMLHSWLP